MRRPVGRPPCDPMRPAGPGAPAMRPALRIG